MSPVGRSVAAIAAADTAGAAAGSGPQQPALTVASIWKQYTEPFLQRYHDGLSSHVASTLVRIGYCRTAALNGRMYRCPGCESQVPLYNSVTVL